MRGHRTDAQSNGSVAALRLCTRRERCGLMPHPERACDRSWAAPTSADLRVGGQSIKAGALVAGHDGSACSRAHGLSQTNTTASSSSWPRPKPDRAGSFGDVVEHCSYKSSVYISGRSHRGTAGLARASGRRAVDSRRLAAIFKIESHNHPSLSTLSRRGNCVAVSFATFLRWPASRLRC